MTQVYSSSAISCVFSFKDCLWRRSYNWKISNFNGKMEGSQSWTATESGAEELIYEEGLKTKGGLPGWFRFPYPLLVTQGTLWVVGEVIVKESWQGVVSHPLCDHTQPWSTLHGGLGGQQKRPLDSEQPRAMDAGWLGADCVGALAHMYFEGLNILCLYF